MAAETAERRLVAILSADVVGYSRLMAEDEDATVRRIADYREEVGLLVRQHRGRLVDFTGDNFLAEFGSALDAVQCGVEIQRVLGARNADVPAGRRMEFRIGAHLGDVRVEGERIFCDGVNIAARLEGLAAPGGLCLSAAIRDQVESKLDLVWEDLGEQAIKNMPKPVHAFRAGPGSAAPGAGREPERSSLAVLPFANMSGDPEQEYFADGISEDLITDLSNVSGLLVISRNSSFTYKGRSVRVDEVGRELGVRYVLEGSVRRAGDRVRINAQLIEADSGHHLWAERYDRELADIFAVQDEVTEQIVSALRVTLRPDERERVRRIPTQNLEAYDFFLRGEALLYRLDPEQAERAVDLFERAIELDPGFADAYLGKALVRHNRAMVREGPDSDAMREAIELAREAVRLDDSSRAHSILGLVLSNARRWDEGMAEAQRALELNPSDASAYTTLGGALNHRGRAAEAIEALEESLRLDPHGSPITFFYLGISHQELGDYDRAIEAFGASLSLAPDLYISHFHQAAAWLAKGDRERAQAAADAGMRANPSFSIEAFRRVVPARNQETIDHFASVFAELGVPERSAD